MSVRTRSRRPAPPRHHLKDLYNQFGDWYLAMAAYNSGAGTVQHAVERTGYADFWELYKRGVLPQETRNYVPIILAVTIMAKNPEQYGLEGVAPEPAQPIDQVTIDYPVDLRLVAECVDTSVDYLQEFNPSLLRMTTPKDQTFTLNLPAASQEKYETAIALVPQDMRTYWRYHKVEYGDTLPSIARKYHITAASIAEANNLSDDEVKAGSKLIIPIAPGTMKPRPSPTPIALRITRCARAIRVESVADDFEVPVDKLRKWNHLRGTALLRDGPWSSTSRPPRRMPRRSPPTPRAPHPGPGSSASHTTQSAEAAKYHKVKKGETLSSIAESNHTSVAALKRDNPNLTANVRAGEVLLIRK